MRIYLIVLSMLFWGAASAQDTMAKPKRIVTDFSGKLTAEQVKTLEGIAQKLYKAKSTETYVIVLDSLPAGQNLIGFTKGIFKKWELNSSNGGNNFVMIYVPRDKGLRIEGGDAVIKTVTKEYIQRVISESMIPLLKQRRDFDALKKGLEMMALKLENN
jgi:uncharacterized protein